MLRPLASALRIAVSMLAVTGAGAVRAETPARPRVCLALSGGGALGLAHVGVLRALEEMRVPIDCVAGTSMGAIVGGLYAAGYSPAELEELALTLDWSGFVRDAPDRRHLPYRRKVDDQLYLTRWEFGVSKSGLELPAGLVSGHRLGVELRILGLRAVGVESFDDLPIPFRAVAADAASGEAVVLDRGNLASALRASMAVPGLFAPVERDGRLLVDGGVVANVPVDAALDMGAEVVIAIDLGEPLEERDRPKSIAGVVSQSLDALRQRESARALAKATVVVRPELEEWGLLDFHAAAELVERGASAAHARAGGLRRWAVDPASWESFLEGQRRSTPSFQIEQVVLEPGPGLPLAAVRRAVRTRPGEPLDPDLLSADLDRLWELGEFETVDFTLEPVGSGGWDLRLVGHRKSWGPNFLRTGLAIASDLEGSSSFNLLGALTMTGRGRFGREVKVAAQAGEAPALITEIYQPVAGSRVPFAALGLQAAETKERVLVDDVRVQYRILSWRASFDLGLALGRWGEVRVGYRHQRTRSHAFGETPSDLPDFDRDHSGLGAYLAFDQLDRVNFPRRGLLVVADYHEARTELGADEDYRRLDVQSVTAATAGRHSLIALIRGHSGLGGELPPDEWTGVGGLFDLSGLPPGDVVGSYGAVGTLIYLYRLGHLPKFGEGIYVGLSLETGNAWKTAEEVSASDLRRSFALVFGADTFLGPIYVGHGHTTGGSDSFYLYIGRTF